jgi:outer membrane receptor protein involved in Fe transport
MMKSHLLRASALAGAAGLMIAGQTAAQTPSPAVSTVNDDTAVEALVVTGSRIPRIATEGPAPVTVITSDSIKAAGFNSVPDVLRSLTQNGGETQTQQSSSGADWTPGAQQVDLRGLGPNHTLVLVNGRRIADFPLPFNGKSAFTDTSSIPLGMIDRIEVLSGSASAVYGSDAISGVVNFNLKKKVDGTTVDATFGGLEHGGAASQRVNVSTGWSKGDFDLVIGGEFVNQKPLWAYDRSIQDSTKDAPTAGAQIARRDFLRMDPDEDVYLDPGNRCDALSGLNGGSVQRASRPRYGAFDEALDDYGPGYYCGSYSSIGYGTIISERKSANVVASLNYAKSDTLAFFADISAGYSRTRQFQDVLSWTYQDATGSEDGVFYNAFDDKLDFWQRNFTPEEMGGLKKGYIKNVSKTFSITPGVKGSLGGGWDYEAFYNFSQYKSSISWPKVVNSKATAFFLGPQLGVDEDSGYAIFNANPDRLYKPLTTAEFDQITARTTYKPVARQQGVSFQVNKADLFTLPAGPVGFAAVAEYGRQSYKLGLDPLATQNYYYGLRDADGSGSRTHGGVGYEFRAPLLKSLELSTAGRYDRYKYAGSSIDKFTYNGGLEWRPVKSLLVRAAYGTGFRAPDLHYVFAKEGISHPSGTDYYRCRTEEPDEEIGDCSYADEGLVKVRLGNAKLKPETSKSLNYGVVWSPIRNFDISVDYFRVQLANAVLDMSLDSVLRQEADCRIGQTSAGSPVSITSPTCVDALARVVRNPLTAAIQPGAISTVTINPINVATEKTNGIDVAAHYRYPTDRFGTWDFSLAHTWVDKHTSRQYPGDPIENQLAYDSGYDIPRTKSSASVTWTDNRLTIGLHGQRLDRLPNYNEDGWTKATYLYNGTVQYEINGRTRVSLAIDNLLDKKPPRDPGYASYPYYDTSWFDSTGRSYYLQLTHKFGGESGL